MAATSSVVGLVDRHSPLTPESTHSRDFVKEKKPEIIRRDTGKKLGGLTADCCKVSARAETTS